VGSAALGVLGGKGSESKASTTTTAAPTAAKTGLLGGVLDSLLSTTNALTGFGTGFAEWNTSRNVLRSELNVVMGSAAVHATGVKGSGVDVALIDTGVAPVNHMNTDDALLNGPDLSLDYQAGMPASVDGFGHGTHLAGIIAGRDAGVAPEARIVNMKVGASDGAVDVSQVIASIDWVVAHRNDPGMNVRVINLAYGTDSTQSYKSSPLTHAVESAWRNGIVVVVSAGNTGGALVNPATDPFVITVGADDTNDPYNMFDDTVAPYSAVGTAARRVDLLAPGTSITSLRVPGGYADTKYPESRAVFGWYAKASGTSQAAAWTTGAVALLCDIHIDPAGGRGYPFDATKALLPMRRHIRDGDLEAAEFRYDFMGLQCYGPLVGLKPMPVIGPIPTNNITTAEFRMQSAIGIPQDPDAMLWALRKYAHHPAADRLVITEGGFGGNDRLEADGSGVRDDVRVWTHRRNLQAVLTARSEGVPVDGYFAWSYADNVEWFFGRGPRFGLVYVDYEDDYRRIPKDSALWFREMLAGS